jgi:hypothetical protein
MTDLLYGIRLISHRSLNQINQTLWEVKDLMGRTTKKSRGKATFGYPVIVCVSDALWHLCMQCEAKWR